LDSSPLDMEGAHPVNTAAVIAIINNDKIIFFIRLQVYMITNYSINRI
jgi:hypothetical protein